jgi:short-subunit dehydrogenase
MSSSQPVALVTGASSGIGEVFARKLSGRGYHLLLVARRRERLEKLAAELKSAEFVTADLALDSDLRSIENRIAAESNLQFLVNNAGFGVVGEFYKSDLEPQDRMHRLHIIAVERLTHAALRGMVARQIGNIINVSSVAGYLTTPFSISYCATKAWISSFSEGLHLELRAIHSPVRVQALCPGFTYTEFHQASGVDRSVIPRSLWMSAESVVDASLRGLERNRVIVVPGWRYKLFLTVYPRLPRSWKHFIALKYGNIKPQSASRPAAQSD